MGMKTLMRAFITGAYIEHTLEGERRLIYFSFYDYQICLLIIFEFILEHFTVQDVDIKTDPNTGESRGFGFLLYKEEASIEQVVNNGPHNLGLQLNPEFMLLLEPFITTD